MIRRTPRSTRTDTLFPYTTLFRSRERDDPFRTFRLGKRCACIAFLPLCSRDGGSPDWILAFAGTQAGRYVFEGDNHPRESYSRNACTRAFSLSGIKPSSTAQKPPRSEERRVGKEGVSTRRSRWAPYHKKHIITSSIYH